MKAPFYATGAIGDETGFILIFFLGLAFGFFLERAGFGSARKLTSIFYFKDWAVLRVMFTAIVAAMLGLLYLGGMGWIDMEGVSIQPTFLGAQIIGGLLLGVGFIAGGYCPGTSAVALASGKLDSLFYMGGILFGTFAFGAAYDGLQPLYMWGQMGLKTLPQVFGVQAGLIAAAVVLMALAAFTATESFGNRSNPTPQVFHVNLTYQVAGAVTLAVLVFGLMIGYGMASHARASAPVAAAAPAATPVAKPASATSAAGVIQPAAPAPVPGLPGGVKKFKKGSSCS